MQTALAGQTTGLQKPSQQWRQVRKNKSAIFDINYTLSQRFIDLNLLN